MPAATIVTKEETIEVPKKAVSAKDDEESGVCPVAPILWLFGLHNAKKPAAHGSLMSRDEIMAEVSAQKVKMQWSTEHELIRVFHCVNFHLPILFKFEP